MFPDSSRQSCGPKTRGSPVASGVSDQAAAGGSRKSPCGSNAPPLHSSSEPAGSSGASSGWASTSSKPPRRSSTVESGLMAAGAPCGTGRPPRPGGPPGWSLASLVWWRAVPTAASRPAGEPAPPWASSASLASLAFFFSSNSSLRPTTAAPRSMSPICMLCGFLGVTCISEAFGTRGRCNRGLPDRIARVWEPASVFATSSPRPSSGCPFRQASNSAWNRSLSSAALTS
mmetsp:Transcript_23095/g.72685  ORF Transcript_23095/g.72685 Transcript_23095/m.72685 type:complete len:230 (-) Transcript_23095:834-1523(-)